MRPIIIVGTGLAGYSVAKEFRKLDTETPLLFISADNGASYSKPMLSNGFAKNKATEADFVQASGLDMAKQLHATLLSQEIVVSITPKDKTLLLASGKNIEYEKLVLAIGADTIHIPMIGDGVKEVLSINDLWAYEKFRQQLGKHKRIGILGAGLIGSEFANDMASSGYAVSVFNNAPWPLARLLPPEAGRYFAQELERAGVQFYSENSVQQVDLVADGLQLTLTKGEVVVVDLLLSAVGLKSKTDLAKASGLAVNRGIVVNAQLQSSEDYIYALGDCAEVEGLVLPFIMPIMHAARALAKTLAGTPTAVEYPAMPVMVKTPAVPTVVSPPNVGSEGQWHTEVTEKGVKALFRSASGTLLGFALLGDAVAQKQALSKELPLVLG